MSKAREAWDHRPLKAFTGTVIAVLVVVVLFVTGLEIEPRLAALIVGGLFVAELAAYVRRRASS